MLVEIERFVSIGCAAAAQVRAHGRIMPVTYGCSQLLAGAKSSIYASGDRQPSHLKAFIARASVIKHITFPAPVSIAIPDKHLRGLRYNLRAWRQK